MLYATYRYRYQGVENYIKARKLRDHGGCCLATFHEHSLASVLSQRGLPHCFLISQSKDGDFADYLIRKFGFQTVRGSSSKGGKEARREMEHRIFDGFGVGFTVDGPRGPRRVCKAGVLATAQNTKTAIVPIIAVSKNPWVFSKSWDQTKIPKPFSKILVQYGPIIVVDKALDQDEFKSELLSIAKALELTDTLALQNLNQWNCAAKTVTVTSQAS